MRNMKEKRRERERESQSHTVKTMKYYIKIATVNKLGNSKPL